MNAPARGCLALLLACGVLATAAGGAFAAGSPVLGAGTATNLQGVSARLEAEVNPEGLATTLRFEYVTQASYEANQPDGFASASATAASAVGAGATLKTASADVAGLLPSTAYRFRARAVNSAGTATGAEGTFTTTEGFGFLPGTAGFDVALSEADGSPAQRAGTHPYALRMSFNLRPGGEFEGQPGAPFSDGDLRDLRIELPPGLLINPTAVGACSRADFNTPRDSPFQVSLSGEDCPDDSQVGTVAVRSSFGATRTFGLFNLTPRHGAPATLGFAPFGMPIEIVPRLREETASLVFEIENFPQRLNLHGIDLTLWGTPWASPAYEDWSFPHDGERGDCLNEADPASPFGDPARYGGGGYEKGTCSIGNPVVYPPKSLLTLPVACQGPLTYAATATSWQQDAVARQTVQGHDSGGNPVGIVACNKSLVSARARLTTDFAASATGLAFELIVNDGGGVTNPAGIARPPIRRAILRLPDGLTINPSVGAGLGTCSPSQFARETVDSDPGAGCPNPSKIGDVSIESLLGLPDPVVGSLFIATPYDNPFGKLLGLYMVVKSPQRGIFLKAAGKVEPDPRNGRLVTTFEDLPQLLYTKFTVRFREGNRAALTSPPACGTHTTAMELTPWPEPDTVLHDASSFQILHGEGGGTCPGGAARPFDPQLIAGSLNPNAGSYTPFLLRMTRTDAEQEITSYSATFPPGLLGKLAGLSKCSDATIEAAKSRTASEEEANPSCPASSYVGRSLVGEGVGQTLAYAPGAFYLAGPYNGSALSIAAITAARVGPFDLGTVVVRSAIRIDARTAHASIDPTGSDKIPHIIDGIPIHVREIRVYMDRPGFTLNPTSCDPLATASTLTGAGTDVFNGADDVAATATDRFQVLNCSALPFAPKLSFRLKGPTKRGGYPALHAHFEPGTSRANVRSAAVTLPRSMFLAQEHIGTVCTRTQFAADQCPAGSVYGHARAVTPLLGEPLEGPVYLRSSSNRLPDVVAALSGGGVESEIVGRIDAVRGGLRGSFEVLPDAPVTEFDFHLRGGKRGVLVNSEDLCAAPQRANVRMIGQNNKTAAFKSRLAVKCKKKKKKSRGGGR